MGLEGHARNEKQMLFLKTCSERQELPVVNRDECDDDDDSGR